MFLQLFIIKHTSFINSIEYTFSSLLVFVVLIVFVYKLKDHKTLYPFVRHAFSRLLNIDREFTSTRSLLYNSYRLNRTGFMKETKQHTSSDSGSH